ncbi:MAG: ABC transporter ATP-binding protein [Deltaproteobacteria bacterium]|jgi:NitT/TauT family transport system ATP-binding protein/sulfonate transport system ATP-binding protein|nr:ABC transporter ATP-binding protein [Deltaproteobacteria bacterium]
MDDYILSCQDLTVSFKDSEPPVLRGLTLGVRENEFLVILGPGQCGKTVFLNCLAGLQLPTEGAVYYRHNKVVGPGRERGVVFQKYALFPWQTVLGNVAWGLKSQGVSKEKRRAIALKYIQLVGLSGFENAYPQTLSGGMKQRVGLARAYATGPKVLLMDEPFGALDAQTRYAMENELLILWEKEKRTVIFVTNNIEEAVFLGDRVILMSARPGRIKIEREILIPHPRSYTDPTFLALRQEISAETDLAL